jgi:hypothetical protein
MHCELVVPALFAARETPPLPSLELLWARGRVSHESEKSPETWLAKAFQLTTLPSGALTVLALGGEPGTDWWLRADPVHLRVGRDGLSLVPSAGFTVTREEAEALAGALNAHFGGEMTFFPMHPGRWCARLARPEALEACAPIEIAGESIDAHLPDARWHARLNEIQMVLHAHPVNEARAVPVNSLWLWGAGALPASARGPWQSVTGDDPAAAGLARLAGMRQRPLAGAAGAWLDRAPDEGRHLVLLDSLRGAKAMGDLDFHANHLEALERTWFAPLLQALKSGRIGMITIRAPDAGLACETIRGDLRRFWRRARPISAHA